MIRLVTIVMATVLGLAAMPEVQAQSQILIIDNQRVENEAAAYKDFSLQTNDIREAILQLRQALNQGGAVEAEAAELEKQKAIIGNDKYEEERGKLQQKAQLYAQQLQLAELTWDRLREEALRQVERARQPVFRTILKDRGAQIILPKRLVLGNAAGIDVTTEFIELLDQELAQVTLSLPSQQNQQNQQNDSSNGDIEEID